MQDRPFSQAVTNVHCEEEHRTNTTRSRMLLLAVMMMMMMLYCTQCTWTVQGPHCQSALTRSLALLAINCYSIACSPRALPLTSNIKPFLNSEDRDITVGWELGWTGRRALYNPSPSIILPVWVSRRITAPETVTAQPQMHLRCT